ncbi:MAG: metallophosphoesterase [Candidatus Nanoarchaeia archaeon]
MKYLIIGDLHGQKPGIYFNDFDAIIAPGDFCSSDETRKLMFEVIKNKHKNPDYKTEWYELVGKREARRLIKKSISDGRQILEYLNSLDKPVYMVPGNNDWVADKDSKWPFLQQDHFKELTSNLPNIINVHKKLVDLGDYEMIGYGLSSGPEYPQYEEDLNRFTSKELAKKKRSYERDYNKISALFEQASKPVLFLSHNVPLNTELDKINNPSSPRDGQHFGSLVTRNIIDFYQPLICIGGHMHEHFGKCKLNKTIVVNTGYGTGVNTLLKLINGKAGLSFHKE